MIDFIMNGRYKGTQCHEMMLEDSSRLVLSCEFIYFCPVLIGLYA